MLSLLIVFFLIAIITSFLCSLWEAVLLSITPSYAQIQVEQGGALGRRLQAFKENIDRPLGDSDSQYHCPHGGCHRRG